MKRFLCIVLCIVLCVGIAYPLDSRADLRDFPDETDYVDSENDRDEYDSDWDDNSEASFFGGGISGVITVVGIAVAAIIILVILVGMKKRKHKHKHHHHHSNHHSHHHHSHHHHHHHHHHTTSGTQRAQNLRPISEYMELDPAFDLPDFQAKLSNLYVQIQNGWQHKDIEALRPSFTDALFTQMNRQLDVLRRIKQTNHVEKIAVLGVEVRGFHQSGGQDTIVAELQARITDYTVSDETGELISGSRTEEKLMTYEWDLVRPTETLTGEKEAVQPVTCPHCGKALSANETAKCPYCGCAIIARQHDWLISAIRGITQGTQ